MKPIHPLFPFLATIPRGYVTTYGVIAKFLSLPSPRLVGRLLHTNPYQERYPCHRVVHGNRALAQGYAFGGPRVQKRLLEEEGVRFKNGLVEKKCVLDLLYFQRHQKDDLLSSST